MVKADFETVVLIISFIISVIWEFIIIVILRRLKAYQETFEEHNSDYIDVTTTISSLEGYLNEIHNTKIQEEQDVWI